MSIKASDLIKLGTALRYLIDVREGEPLGGKHILDNFRVVKRLIDDLGFRSTHSQEVFGHFEAQHIHLSKLHECGEVVITKKDAGRLERVSRRVRDALLSEATGVEVYLRSPGLPQKLTMSYLWNHVDYKLWLTLVGLIIGSFTAGFRLGSDPDGFLRIVGLDIEKKMQSEQPLEDGP